jgi:hypothetical protein
MSDLMMRSRPAEGYPGRYRSVDAADIAAQRDSGWPDFHPEDFCHRCGNPNVSWFVDNTAWNHVMREGNPVGWGQWQEIICIPCFMELAETHYRACTWRIVREAGSFTEQLVLVTTGSPS